MKPRNHNQKLSSQERSKRQAKHLRRKTEAEQRAGQAYAEGVLNAEPPVVVITSVEELRARAEDALYNAMTKCAKAADFARTKSFERLGRRAQRRKLNVTLESLYPYQDQLADKAA